MAHTRSPSLQKAPRRFSEEGGALAAIPPAPRKEQQSHPGPRGPPFLLVGPPFLQQVAPQGSQKTPLETWAPGSAHPPASVR